MSATPIGETPDPAIVNECFTDDAEDEFGRVLNRFHYCNRFRSGVEYYRIIRTPLGTIRYKIGTTYFTYEIFAQGDEQDRRIRVFARVKEGSVVYDWNDPFQALFVAPNLPLSFIINCVEDFTVCRATRGPVVMPFTTWDHNTDWFYWDVYNFEESGIGRDKISYNRWYLKFEGFGPGFGLSDPGNSAARQIRCDSAAYFNRGVATYPKACIFNEVIPFLTYELGSEFQSVAFHIYEAQEFPNQTYPLLVPLGVPPPRDKRIPGKFFNGDPTKPGLHRIREGVDPEYQSNGEHKDGACYNTGPVANLYIDLGLPSSPDGAPDPTTEDCDEYPFASTLEGAAHPFWDFSVKAVPIGDNRRAGNRLGAYYVDDRMLSWDPSLPDRDNTNDRFYVQIP